MIRLGISIAGDPAGVIHESRQGIAGGFKAVVDALSEGARQSVPVRTGSLRESISSSMSGGLLGEIIYGAPHASYLEKGTGIYGPAGKMIVIRPNKKKALFWPGARYPVKVVRQKGIRPRGLVRKAIRGAQIERAFDSGFNSGQN